MLLRRPLFSDPLVVFCLCVVCVILGWSLNGNLAWGGDYNSDRMADFLGKALSGIVALLVLMFLIALIRNGVVGPASPMAQPLSNSSSSFRSPTIKFTHPSRSTPACSFTAPGSADELRRSVHPVESASDSDPAPAPEPAGNCAAGSAQFPSGHGFVEGRQDAPAGARDEPSTGSGQCLQCRTDGRTNQPSCDVAPGPRLREIRLDQTSTTADEPLWITWWFDEARSVTVDGRRGFPSYGSDFVNADVSREIVVTAHGQSTCRIVRLPIVVAQAAPLMARPRGETILDLRGVETYGTFEGRNRRGGGAR